MRFAGIRHVHLLVAEHDRTVAFYSRRSAWRRCSGPGRLSWSALPLRVIRWRWTWPRPRPTGAPGRAAGRSRAGEHAPGLPLRLRRRPRRVLDRDFRVRTRSLDTTCSPVPRADIDRDGCPVVRHRTPAGKQRKPFSLPSVTVGNRSILDGARPTPTASEWPCGPDLEA
jgi:hypothetical protein